MLVLGQRLTSNIESCVTCNFRGILVAGFFVGWVTGIAGRHLMELNARYLSIKVTFDAAAREKSICSNSARVFQLGQI